MSYTAKDGKKFGNVFQGRRADSAHEPKDTKMDFSVKTPHEENENPTATKVVAEHGKAKHVTVTHNYEAKTHKVESNHEDGYTAASDHASADEAHEQGKKLTEDADDQGYHQLGAPSETMGESSDDLI